MMLLFALQHLLLIDDRAQKGTFKMCWPSWLVEETCSFYSAAQKQSICVFFVVVFLFFLSPWILFRSLCGKTFNLLRSSAFAKKKVRNKLLKCKTARTFMKLRNEQLGNISTSVLPLWLCPVLMLMAANQLMADWLTDDLLFKSCTGAIWKALQWKVSDEFCPWQIL